MSRNPPAVPPSVGALMPCVLYGRETERGVMWGVITPYGTHLPAVWSYQRAETMASLCRMAWQQRRAAEVRGWRR